MSSNNFADNPTDYAGKYYSVYCYFSIFCSVIAWFAMPNGKPIIKLNVSPLNISQPQGTK